MPTAYEIKKQLEQNWTQFLNANSARLSLKKIEGSTPPSVFVGRYGYPKVKAGPMVSLLRGDTMVLDMPEIWLGKSIQQIVSYRLSLVRGVLDIDIHTTSGKYIESLQELAMASKSAESEATFEKKPIARIERERDLGDDTESTPFGPVAYLKSFKTISSVSIDKRLENTFYDKDLTASDAIIGLYSKEIEISRIQRALSLGMLGVKKNRRLVPTKWSISAIDNTISADLIKRIEIFSTIDFFEVSKYYHLGNYYSVILIPDDVWSFEMLEVWYDKNGNLGIGADFENANGLDHYPFISGAYFAARLGVTEHLLKRKRKAAALVLREIRSEYVVPLGVWQIREGVRQALKGQRRQFETFGMALSFACSDFLMSKNNWIRNSRIYRNMQEQMRMTTYIDNDFS